LDLTVVYFTGIIAIGPIYLIQTDAVGTVAPFRIANGFSGVGLS